MAEVEDFRHGQAGKPVLHFTADVTRHLDLSDTKWWIVVIARKIAAPLCSPLGVFSAWL